MQLKDLLLKKTYRNAEFLGGDWVSGDPNEDGAVELMIRQGVRLESASVWVNFGCGAWLWALKAAPQNPVAWHAYLEDHIAFKANALSYGEDIESELVLPKALNSNWKEITAPTRLLRLFKDMSLNAYWLDSLLHNMPANGSLHVVGCKDDGIRAIEARLQAAGYRVDTLAVGCHSRWLEVFAEANAKPVEIAAIEEQTIVLPQGNWKAKLPAGVFASGRLDEGSKLLLKSLGTIKNKTVWDVGCGGGAISAAVLLAGAQKVLATDHSNQAVQVAQQNLQMWESKVEVKLAFIADEITGAYDVILSNPPFHMERREMHDLGRAWIKALKPHMARGGEMRIVANAFLAYDEFAKLNGLQAQCVIKEGGFKIWRVYAE